MMGHFDLKVLMLSLEYLHVSFSSELKLRKEHHRKVDQVWRWDLRSNDILMEILAYEIEQNQARASFQGRRQEFALVVEELESMKLAFKQLEQMVEFLKASYTQV